MRGLRRRGAGNPVGVPTQGSSEGTFWLDNIALDHVPKAPLSLTWKDRSIILDPGLNMPNAVPAQYRPKVWPPWHAPRCPPPTLEPLLSPSLAFCGRISGMRPSEVASARVRPAERGGRRSRMLRRLEVIRKIFGSRNARVPVCGHLMGLPEQGACHVARLSVLVRLHRYPAVHIAPSSGVNV